MKTFFVLHPVLWALLLTGTAPPAAHGAGDTAVPSPDLANSQLYSDLATATRQNEQLKAALAEAQVRLSLREGDLTDLSRQVAALNAAAGSPAAATAGLKAEIEQLHHELDKAREAATAAQAQLAADRAMPRVAAQPYPPPGPAPELALLHQDLDQARAAAAAAQIAQAGLENQLQQAGQLLADTRAQLAAARAVATTTGQPPPAPDHTAELAQLHEDLDQARAAATTVQTDRANWQSQLEQSAKQLADVQAQLGAARARADEAKALATERDGLRDHLASQQTQIDRLIAELAAVPVKPEPAEVAATTATIPSAPVALDQQLADANDKITEVLRAFTLQQTELDQVKTMLADTDAARITATDQLAAVTKIADDRAAAQAGVQQELAAQRATTASITGELANLREQLRLTQATADAATAENEDLKTRLALAGGQTAPSPVRPVIPLGFTPPAEPAPAAAEPPPAVIAEPRVHLVIAGDTLSGLAKKYYGNAARWNTILDANHTLIKNPDMLPLGAKLQIP